MTVILNPRQAVNEPERKIKATLLRDKKDILSNPAIQKAAKGLSDRLNKKDNGKSAAP
jgi:hypothetical protein